MNLALQPACMNDNFKANHFWLPNGMFTEYMRQQPIKQVQFCRIATSRSNVQMWYAILTCNTVANFYLKLDMDKIASLQTFCIATYILV